MKRASSKSWSKLCGLLSQSSSFKKAMSAYMFIQGLANSSAFDKLIPKFILAGEALVIVTLPNGPCLPRRNRLQPAPRT